MYFDTVVDCHPTNGDLKPLFTGQPDEILSWLRDNPQPADTRISIYMGASNQLTSIAQYQHKHSSIVDR